MSTSLETLQFIADQLSACDLGAVEHRKMFGEYGVYLDERLFALVCDDRLFFKVAHLEPDVREALFDNADAPYPGAKGYSDVSAWLEDVPALEARMRTVLATLPPPKPKKPRASKKRPSTTA